MKIKRNLNHIKSHNLSQQESKASLHNRSDIIKTGSDNHSKKNNTRIPEFRAACLFIEDKQKNRVVLLYEPYWSSPNDDTANRKINPERLLNVYAEYKQHI
jgi:hypothetical protein